jgi:hypothetical protein
MSEEHPIEQPIRATDPDHLSDENAERMARAASPGQWERIDAYPDWNKSQRESSLAAIRRAWAARPAPAMASEIATLKARVAELEAADATPYREALGQIVQLLAEERALNGGGPNFRVRWTKALDEAEELMRIEP